MGDDPIARAAVTLAVNGEALRLDVAPNRTLMQLLREDAGLLGTKDGCRQGACGACTVLLDGAAVRACMTLAVRCDGKAVTTVEGRDPEGRLERLREAFASAGAVQCGYCTPGMLMMACALLGENPAPGEAEVREALIGNLCRCTGYERIVAAVVAAGRPR